MRGSWTVNSNKIFGEQSPKIILSLVMYLEELEMSTHLWKRSFPSERTRHLNEILYLPHFYQKNKGEMFA